MDSAKISVIVPIYKVENYLDRCVQSILNQTYQNLEIILVDDGSPDRCPAMCDAYAQKDSRVKVIHKQNGGLSDARNAGIDIADGDYLGFVDSDDYIHKDMYAQLMKSCMEYDCDIAVCAIEKFSGRALGKLQDRTEAELYEKDEIFNALLKVHDVEMIVAWNKLYKKDTFAGVRYPVGKIHEDEFTTYKALGKCRKVVYINQPLYFYLQREDSIMGKGFSARSLDRLEALKERQIFFDTQSEYIQNMGLYNLQFWILLYLYQAGDDEALRRKVLDYEKWCWEQQDKGAVKEYLYKALFACLRQKQFDRTFMKHIFQYGCIRSVTDSNLENRLKVTDKRYWFRSGRKMKYLMYVMSYFV